MAAEIWFNYLTSKTLYAAVFQRSDGLVFLSVGGGTPEVWGTSGDADFYDITMTETTAGASMHYVGTFSSNFDAGVYRITVYDQAGANPADSDIAIAEAEIHWDGTAEIDVSTVTTTINAILVADRTAIIVINEEGSGGGTSIPIISITEPARP